MLTLVEVGWGLLGQPHVRGAQLKDLEPGLDLQSPDQISGEVIWRQTFSPSIEGKLTLEPRQLRTMGGSLKEER